MSRVLMVPFAPTDGLAHLGACAAVGGELRRRGHEVVFGYGGSLGELLEREGFPVEPVLELPPEREWDPAGWFRSTAEVRRLVDSQLELIARLRPDAVVTSSGVASRLACEIAGVPQLHLMHYLPFTRPGRSPALVWGNRVRDLRHPRRLGRRLRAQLRRPPGAHAADHRLIHETRRELGLPEPGGNAIGGCRDSLVALTTAPRIDPAGELPKRWRYVGPITWSAPVDGSVPKRGARPLVYVTQGSTGSADLLQLAVGELAAEPVDVLVSTGGLIAPRELERLGLNVRAARLLPGRACLEAADVAVVHGGHLTCLEALTTGTPVAVIPYRRNQYAQASRAERLGTGIGIWPSTARPGAVGKAVRRLLGRPRYRRRAEALAATLSENWDGARNAADLVEELTA